MVGALGPLELAHAWETPFGAASPFRFLQPALCEDASGELALHDVKVWELGELLLWIRACAGPTSRVSNLH
eukprot:13409154-Alexandrium_andersonii.AAC.1